MASAIPGSPRRRPSGITSSSRRTTRRHPCATGVGTSSSRAWVTAPVAYGPPTISTWLRRSSIGSRSSLPPTGSSPPVTAWVPKAARSVRILLMRSIRAVAMRPRPQATAAVSELHMSLRSRLVGGFGVLVLLCAGGIDAQEVGATPPASVAPRAEFAFEFHVNLLPPVVVGETPFGRRQYIPIAGGQIAGPKFTGEVLAGGWDYQLGMTNGCSW